MRLQKYAIIFRKKNKIKYFIPFDQKFSQNHIIHPSSPALFGANRHLPPGHYIIIVLNSIKYRRDFNEYRRDFNEYRRDFNEYRRDFNFTPYHDVVLNGA